MRKIILVIAPHPDDEVLGCGGTIANHCQQGDAVYLCVVTKAYTPDWSKKFLKDRPKKVQRANKILGIKKTYFLDFPTVKLDTIPQKKLNEAILGIVKKVNPDVLFIPHRGDLNRDHRLIFEASLVATRPGPHQVSRILSYESLSETEWGQPIAPFLPNVYVDISKTLDKKIAAMKCNQEEIRPMPHPRSLEIIKSLAQKRGSEAGLLCAESFALIKETIR